MCLCFQIPQLSDEDDEDDETPYNDDTLVPPSTSTQTGRVQPKQQGKKTKGSSDLVSVLKEVLQADRGQENDIRKTVSSDICIMGSTVQNVHFNTHYFYAVIRIFHTSLHF
jgi:hypothetical protein